VTIWGTIWGKPSWWLLYRSAEQGGTLWW
jgi:hypothetical protein